VLLIVILVATILAFYMYKNLDQSGALSFCIFLCFGCLDCEIFTLLDLHLLPKEIRWSYEEWFDEKKRWDFQGGFVDGKKQGIVPSHLSSLFRCFGFGVEFCYFFLLYSQRGFSCTYELRTHG
jgi:hypothetical protein